jgi:hypothetical protein
VIFCVCQWLFVKEMINGDRKLKFVLVSIALSIKDMINRVIKIDICACVNCSLYKRYD